jgi:cytoskeletal protein CcmA (bactofilin family)
MIFRREDHSGSEAVRIDKQQRQEARRMAQEGEVTVIGLGAKLEGNIMSAGSLRIDGQVKGEISAEGDVMLSPQSHVEADVQAENVIVAGRLKGNVSVKGRAEVGRGGRIEGDITSKTLVVQEGGVFSGRSIMDQQAVSAPSQAGAAPRTAPPPPPGTPGSGDGASERARAGT